MFFKEIIRFKGRVLRNVIGVCSPLDIITGGKIMFSLLLTKKFGENVIWFVTSLSMINREKRNKSEEALAAITLRLVDCDIIYCS